MANSVCVARIDAGFLKLRGRDSVDFLQRLSTNDLDGLDPRQYRSTILTNEKGRIIDVITVVHQGDHLLLVCSGGNNARVQEWLEKFIVMEDIQVSNATSDLIIAAVIGTHATSALSRWIRCSESIVGESLIELVLSDHPALAYQDVLWDIPRYNIILEQGNASDCLKVLQRTLKSVGQNVLEAMRIERGVPIFGKEITEQVNPLEANLERLVSFTKGCYIGQEVVARVDTYQKLQKNLRGFVLDTVGETVRLSPGRISLHEREVGWTTSHTWSTKFQKNIALGYLRTDVRSERVEVIPSETNQSYFATVATLPFNLQ